MYFDCNGYDATTIHGSPLFAARYAMIASNATLHSRNKLSNIIDAIIKNSWFYS